MSEALQYLLSGGIVGGIIDATITQLATAWRARKERKRERDGLLRLLSLEIVFNRTLFLEDYLHKDQNDAFLAASSGRSLSMDVWQEARSRIAQLLPADKFSSLVEYYVNLQAFNNLLDEHTPPKNRVRDLPGLADSLANDLGPEVRRWIRDYIGPTPTPPGVSE